ncbi:DNA primase [Synergistales bacterium]|nr:DNA primase [Synergistales bacterium]
MRDRDNVEEVRSRIDIAELVGDYVALQRSGSSLRGLCPFHSEKTPSFYVSPEKQTFHCFGCGKGGDIFTFIEEIDGISFKEALDRLAERAGVTIERRLGARTEIRAKDARAVLADAGEFFRKSLADNEGGAARAYLSRRGIGADICGRFALGWSPSSWNSLSKWLVSKGHSEEDAISSGLSARSDKGYVYDRFRGRVMFQILDDMGRVSGFGGRIIDGEGAKYINSPESELYNKRRILYLLRDAKKSIRERGRVILTEGYMDALRAHVAGFTETVASLGTSLTEEQAALIKRFCGLCYIAYDSDGAGREASVRGMYILQRAGVSVRVISLPDGRDPDDLLSEEGGADIFSGLIEEALPLPLYHAHIRRRDIASPELGQSAREDVLFGLASLDILDVQPYVPRIAQIFGVLQHQLEREIERRKRSSRAEYNNEAAESRPLARRAFSHADAECALLGLFWSEERLRFDISPGDIMPYLSDGVIMNIMSALLAGEGTRELEDRWREVDDRTCLSIIARGHAVISENGIKSEHAAQLIADLRNRSMRRRYDALKTGIMSGRASEAEMGEYFELAKKLKSG